MLKKLLFRPVTGLMAAAMLCSFMLTEKEREREKALEKNELAYSDTRITLNFGGIEELISREDSHCYRTDIYLSDIDLNNAGINSQEQVVLKLKNHMMSGSFVNGTYPVMQECTDNRAGVIAELLSLNGSSTSIVVESGEVHYTGEYPQIKLDFELKLSNGESLQGSFDRPMNSFKYFF